MEEMTSPKEAISINALLKPIFLDTTAVTAKDPFQPEQLLPLIGKRDPI